MLEKTNDILNVAGHYLMPCLGGITGFAPDCINQQPDANACIDYLIKYDCIVLDTC